MTGENNRPQRTVARRVFAGEFSDATHSFKESAEERAPNFLLLPTGGKANRVFITGTLTETKDVGKNSEYWQGRVVDPAGDTFFAYAGKYQPEAASTLRQLEPPTYLAVVGKARTFETDDGETNVSVEPETVTKIDAETRDRWVVQTAKRTIDRVRSFQSDESGDYAELAQKEYGDDIEEYRQSAISALEAIEGDVVTSDEPEADNSKTTSTPA